MFSPKSDDSHRPTAMELVRRAHRGELSHEQLVAALETWPFQPQYRTKGESDDWEFVEDSLDAVVYAYIELDLLSEDEYNLIADGSDEGLAALIREREGMTSEPLSGVAARFGLTLDAPDADPPGPEVTP